MEYEVVLIHDLFCTMSTIYTFRSPVPWEAMAVVVQGGGYVKDMRTRKPPFTHACFKLSYTPFIPLLYLNHHADPCISQVFLFLRDVVLLLEEVASNLRFLQKLEISLCQGMLAIDRYELNGRIQSNCKSAHDAGYKASISYSSN